MSLESDTQQNIQGKLDFSSSQAGEAHEAGREEPESLPAVHGPESSASTNRSMEEVCERENLKEALRRVKAGLATQATCASALRPSRLPISASLDLSGSDRRKRAGKCARRVLFSAGQVLVLEEQFPVDLAGQVGKQSQPLIVLHVERP
jgi:hypothetical protein